MALAQALTRGRRPVPSAARNAAPGPSRPGTDLGRCMPIGWGGSPPGRRAWHPGSEGAARFRPGTIT
ncbi:hypothetical protein I5Q34_26275 [Streptomyces sp. AV19]|uniref:hypothetical protein n=1 Tax=Streptomyces sp. AV19 TaxID=2793068 RepID=UPI0018FEE875|nr:hypothetical protein [Streptomyces sp. AV19]MBH1937737.1 hypothetical protein [Streptomyces sp. AV19]MDG4536405.1 hypothetical protein [Streptomyces sp. AV19]